MPAVTSINLASILRRHMSEEKLTQKDIAILAEISPITINRFLKHRTQPQRETCAKIEEYLKQAGALTRFGFPTQPLPVEVTKEDKEQLREMGIRPYQEPRLNESEKRFLIYAVYSAEGPQEQKDRLLDKVLSLSLL